jgi:DNA-binding NarL/FixJ family response regulator
MTRPIRVAVIDPHPIFRVGVVRTLARSPDLSLVAQGETKADACRALEETAPDILIIDHSGMDDGTKELKELSKICPSCKLIVLTALDDVLSISSVLAIGVNGYILKGVSGIELIESIKAVHSGQPVVTPELASRLLMDAKGGPLLPLRDAKLQSALSFRERQVLDHISKGLTNKEAAEQLGIKVKTIKYHLTQVFKKLGVTNRVQALQAMQKAESD